MSYCRFGSDQFRCDVYVYESVGDFWAIHVAGNRLVSEEPRPDPPPSDWYAQGESGVAAFMAADKAMDEWMERATREEIALPYAGESICGYRRRRSGQAGGTKGARLLRAAIRY